MSELNFNVRNVKLNIELFVPVTLHRTVITEPLGSCQLLPLYGHYHLHTALHVVQSTVRVDVCRCIARSHGGSPLLSYVTQRLTLLLLLLLMMEMMLTR